MCKIEIWKITKREENITESAMSLIKKLIIKKDLNSNHIFAALSSNACLSLCSKHYITNKRLFPHQTSILNSNLPCQPSRKALLQSLAALVYTILCCFALNVNEIVFKWGSYLRSIFKLTALTKTYSWTIMIKSCFSHRQLLHVFSLFFFFFCCCCCCCRCHISFSLP